MTLANRVDIPEDVLAESGPVLLTAPAANQMEFPVTAFDNLEAALRLLDEKFDELDVEDVATSDDGETIHIWYDTGQRRALADGLWDSWYFMADAPWILRLRVTWNQFELFDISDD